MEAVTNHYAVPEKEVVESEIDNQQNPVDTEEDSVIVRAGNSPIVDFSQYDTKGKEALYIQIKHIVKLFFGWCLIFVDDQIVIPFDLR